MRRKYSVKKLFPILAFLLGGQIFSSIAQDQPPGVIEGLKVLVEDSREKLSKVYSDLQKSGQIIENPTQEQVQNLKISNVFLRSLFLHSEKKYLEMIALKECHLYALIENKLLKSALGNLDYLIVEEAGRQQLIKAETYIEQIYKFKCQANAQFSKIFNRATLKKTVMSLKYPVPKTEKQCGQILEDWRKNDYLPYLCKIPHLIQLGVIAQTVKSKTKRNNINKIRALNEIIRSGEYYKNEIPFFQRSYLKNLCEGVQSDELFCRPYLATDAWTRIINGELSENHLIYKCLNFFKKSYSENLTDNQKRTCIKRMKESASLCIDKGAEGYSSLFPRPNCSLISKALNSGRLKVPYHDCPGQVDNGAITNLHRVLSHYLDRDISSTPETCQAEANLTLLNLLKEAKNTRGWPLKVCYFDKIESKEICHDYIPGSLEKTGISEEKVVTKILQRLTSISTSQSCRVVGKSRFNPSLLEYKNGCFIVFDEKTCSNAFCPKEIIVDEKKVTGLKFIGTTEFDYAPNNWRDQKKSGLMMMEDAYKLRSKKLRNLTELEVFFKKNPKAIVHGIGCSEDMLPQFFKRHEFSQCQPLPFILDGVIKENDNMVLVTRTALDDLHSPRLIPWNWIFTGVMKYKAKHSLNQWNLYGIK